MLNQHTKKLFAVFITLSLASLVFLSFAPTTFGATDDYVPLAGIPGTYDPSTGTTNLSTYLTGAFKVGIAAAGVLAFLMIVYGGFTYLSTDAITGKEEGKERIERALGGLVLALAAYIILYTINPSLVNLNLYFGERADPCPSIKQLSDNPQLKPCAGTYAPGDLIFGSETEDGRLSQSFYEAEQRLAEIKQKEKQLKELQKAGNTAAAETLQRQIELDSAELSGQVRYNQALEALAQTKELGIKPFEERRKAMNDFYDTSIQKLSAQGDQNAKQKLEADKLYRNTAFDEELKVAELTSVTSRKSWFGDAAERAAVKDANKTITEISQMSRVASDTLRRSGQQATATELENDTKQRVERIKQWLASASNRTIDGQVIK